MEPVSTFIILGAMLVATPATKQQEIVHYGSSSKSQKYIDAGTDFVLPAGWSGVGVPKTQSLIEVSKFHKLPAIIPRELLKREIVAYCQYGNGWNGPDTVGPTSEQITSTNAFVEAIPARLPLPRPMLSANGEIGLYWDLSGGYAEASFESDGNMTFFSRTRSGKEYFKDNVQLININDNWFWNAVGSLDVLDAVA
jgi:hypothetical protein